MKDYYKMKTCPLAHCENVICGEKYRITVLTDCLLRLEYSQDGKFEDRATQTVVNRDFKPAEFKVTEKEGRLILKTAALQLIYNGKEFSSHGLSIHVKDKNTALHSIWHFGDFVDDLRGTARTLDGVNGDHVELDHGLISRQGYAVLDDSQGLLLTSDGWIEPREDQRLDLYFFGYGHDYKGALRDFYYLCGRTPMLPRFALGNWWSRYYRYSQESYLNLMEKFKTAGIPLSVAVIDMDWHLVDIDPKYGSGWTGFTWNTELFPEPEDFLKELHQRGMKVTLNLHPADGIRGFEKAYPQIARHMCVDEEAEETVLFDISDPEFLQYYYEDVIYPLEEEGVDFWWMDWQQGSHSRIKNLDPLWMLNHYHFLDNQKHGKRPLNLSRYAGPGSHRYPVGFSGDTIISWESLAFQPYFTAAASNIGYGWWSHDIGGHMKGYKDEELMARWVQFGVFSPIMRLHSTNSPFNSKEPWRFGKETEVIMTDFLRLRHRMLPYLYTMNRRNYEEGLPMILPLYYEHPETEDAYWHRNEYYFGSELLVLPVTSPRIQGIGMAKENLWLPQGIWYDIFTNRVYKGNRTLDIYRELDKIPVFAAAGSILPMTDEIEGKAGSKNPGQLHVCIYLGQRGSFTLYEDDGETCDYEKGSYVKTRMDLIEDEKKGTVFTIQRPEGEYLLLQEKRSYILEFVGCKKPSGEVKVKCGNQETECSWTYRNKGHVLVIDIHEIPAEEELIVEFPEYMTVLENSAEEDIFDFLDRAEISYETKETIYKEVQARKDIPVLLSQLYSMRLEADLMGALTEYLTAF